MTDFASLTLAVDATSADQASVSLDKLTISGAKAEAKAKDLNRSFNMPMAKSASEQIRVMSIETEKLMAKYDPLGTKLRSLESDMARFRAEMGNAYSPAVARTFQGLEDEIVKTKTLMSTAGVDGFAAIEGAAGKSAFATAQARRELIVLGHEAISGNFARMPGSLMVLAERTGASIGLFSGLALAAAAAAAVIGYFAFKSEEADRAMSSLNSQFRASGNQYVVITGQISGLVNELAKLPGVSKSAANEMVGTFARVPEIGNKMRADLLRLAPDIATAFGIEIPKAAQLLAKSFESPEQGAKSLDKELNFLSASQLIAIHNFELSGNTLAAQRVLYDALTDRVKGLHDQGLTPIQFSVNELTHSWENLTDKLGKSDSWNTVRTSIGFIIDRMAWVIDHASAFGKVLNWTNPGISIGQLIGPGVMSANNTQSPSASGKIGYANAPGNAANDSLDMKKAQSIAEAYKGAAREIHDLTLQEQFLRKEQGLVNTSTKEGSELYRQLGDAIKDIDQKIVSLKNRGTKKTGKIIDIPGLWLDDMQLAKKELEQEDKMIADAVKKNQKYAQDVMDISAKVKAITGGKSESAGIEFDKKYADIVAQATEKNDQATLNNTKLLRDYAVAQGQVNDLILAAKDIREKEGIVEARINLDLETGAISQLDAMKRISEARQQEAQDLGVIAGGLDKVAKNDPFPQIIITADKFNLELDKLKATAKQLSDKFNTIFTGSFSSAFSDFITGTKTMSQAFKAFADSVVQQISRIVAEDMASKMFGGSSSGGGIGGFLAGLFTGGFSSASSAGTSIPIDFSSVSNLSGARASGGDVFGGQSYLVGEKGPEIFKASSNGTIIPNGKSAGSNVINIHVTNSAPVNQLTQLQLGKVIGQHVQTALRRNG